MPTVYQLTYGAGVTQLKTDTSCCPQGLVKNKKISLNTMGCIAWQVGNEVYPGTMSRSGGPKEFPSGQADMMGKLGRYDT